MTEETFNILNEDGSKLLLEDGGAILSESAPEFEEAAASTDATTALAAPRQEKYLRNRPFLLVGITRRPTKASNVRTHVKGWGDNPGHWDTFETPSLVDRVNGTHLTNSAVIIDVLNTKIVKNQFSDTPDEQVVQHYMNKYSAQITEAMNIWLSQLSKKVAEINAANAAA